MSDIYDIRSQMFESELMHQKQFRDEVERKEKIARENTSLKLQSDATKELQDLKAIFQKQREIDMQNNIQERYQRHRERKEDRKFLWKVTLFSAVIGGVVASVITIILERIFK